MFEVNHCTMLHFEEGWEMWAGEDSWIHKITRKACTLTFLGIYLVDPADLAGEAEL